MKYFLNLILCATLVGCAFGKDNTDTNKAQLRQNQVIDSTYGSLVGTYSGTMNTARGLEQVNLSIYILSDAITNPDGTPGIKRTPMAHFKRISPIADDFYLSPRGYSKEAGTLSLVNINAAGADDVRSMDLSVSGQSLLGFVQTSSGTLGSLNLKLSTNQTDVPGGSAEADRRERLLKLYNSIAGEYVGQINSANNSGAIPISITLSVFNPANSLPSITAFYRRLDAPGGIIDMTMNAEYNTSTNPPRLTMDGSGGGNYILSINAVLINNQIQGDITSKHQGYLGKIILKKK